MSTRIATIETQSPIVNLASSSEYLGIAQFGKKFEHGNSMLQKYIVMGMLPLSDRQELMRPDSTQSLAHVSGNRDFLMFGFNNAGVKVRWDLNRNTDLPEDIHVAPLDKILFAKLFDSNDRASEFSTSVVERWRSSDSDFSLFTPSKNGRSRSSSTQNVEIIQTNDIDKLPEDTLSWLQYYENFYGNTINLNHRGITEILNSFVVESLPVIEPVWDSENI